MGHFPPHPFCLPEPYRLTIGVAGIQGLLTRPGVSVWIAASSNRSRDVKGPTMNLTVKDLAREELTSLFRQRVESGKSYCAACLVKRLTQRFSGSGAHASVEAAVDTVFEQPGSLRVSPSGTCAACLKP